MRAVRSIWAIAKAIIIGSVLGSAVHFGSGYLDTLDTVNVRNRAVAHYNTQQFRLAVSTFEAAWGAGEPRQEDRATYADAATEAGTLAYEDAIRSHVGFDDAYWLLDAAARHGELDDRRTAYRLDAAICCGEFTAARLLLDELRAAGSYDGRIPTLDKKLQERLAYTPQLDRR